VRLVVGIPLREPWEYEIAMRPIAGAPWVARLRDRLLRARSVERVVVLAWGGVRGTPLEGIEPAVASDLQSVDASQPRAALQALAGDADGVAFCPVTQLFADPERLDALAGLAGGLASGRAIWVAEYDPHLPLAGGAYLDLHVRGPEASGETVHAFPAWPEAFEMRLETPADFDWAAVACEHLLAADPSGALGKFEAVIGRADLGRFAFWDRIGPRPQRILTVRCVTAPLFEGLMRHLGRIPSARVDVVCAEPLAPGTLALAGVRSVFTYDAPRFSVSSLPSGAWDAIRAERYDLCVVPCLAGDAPGFENVRALGNGSGACTAVWLDPFGRSGLIEGRAQGWDETVTLPGPAAWAPRLETMRQRALRGFARSSRPGAPAVAFAGTVSTATEALGG
jgi:hypothetical protein